MDKSDFIRHIYKLCVISQKTMKKKIHLIILLLFPLFVLAQNNYDPLKTHDEQINSLYHKIDSISNNIYLKYNLDDLKYSHQYIEDINNYKNVITTNYWINDIKVNFAFKDENLSYLTPKKFDDFRRDFYKEKKLNVLVYLDNEQLKKSFFKTSSKKNRITYFKNEDYITTTIFYKNLERFLILEYYFENGKPIKIKIRELNSQFQWDKINYTEFFYDNSEIIFRKLYQSLMDGRFGLDRKFSGDELKKIATETLRKIKNK